MTTEAITPEPSAVQTLVRLWACFDYYRAEGYTALYLSAEHSIDGGDAFRATYHMSGSRPRQGEAGRRFIAYVGHHSPRIWIDYRARNGTPKRISPHVAPVESDYKYKVTEAKLEK